MTKYSVGLDIGIASVGWSIVDIDEKKIVDLGSRIFPSGNAAANQERRGFRGTRRLIIIEPLMVFAPSTFSYQ